MRLSLPAAAIPWSVGDWDPAGACMPLWSAWVCAGCYIWAGCGLCKQQVSNS